MMKYESDKTYSISELARLAGISVRTLHHYDQIGLLQPGERNPENDYRIYHYPDLLRLQQILFFRELDFPLKKIKQILDDPEVDQIELLARHHHHLGLRIARLKKLQTTIEKTIQNLQEEEYMPLTDQELYEGFNQETIDRYKKEVKEKYDPKMVQLADRNARKLNKSEWAAVKQEGIAIAAELSKLIDRDPQDNEVQALAARQHAWIENFYPASAEMFRSLGLLYTTNQEFRDFYDRVTPGLADFLKEAMDHYADTVLDR